MTKDIVIEIFDNTAFPILMTANPVGSGYPLVHAVLRVDTESHDLIVYFQELWKEGQEDLLEEVKTALIQELHVNYGHHDLAYEIDGELMSISRVLPNRRFLFVPRALGGSKV